MAVSASTSRVFAAIFGVLHVKTRLTGPLRANRLKDTKLSLNKTVRTSEKKNIIGNHDYITFLNLSLKPLFVYYNNCSCIRVPPVSSKISVGFEEQKC